MAAIEIERTTDYEFVRAVVQHRYLFGTITDDRSASMGPELRPPEDPNLIYLRVRDGSAELGVIAFVPLTSVLFQVHIWLLPAARGKAVWAGLRALKWLWRNTGCQRVRGEIPVFNRLAISYAERMGMERIGTDRAAYQKHGKLWDLALYGIGREGN